jgi:hypothetical protein
MFVIRAETFVPYRTRWASIDLGWVTAVSTQVAPFQSETAVVWTPGAVVNGSPVNGRPLIARPQAAIIDIASVAMNGHWLDRPAALAVKDEKEGKETLTSGKKNARTRKLSTWKA